MTELKDHLSAHRPADDHDTDDVLALNGQVGADPNQAPAGVRA